MDMLRKLWPTPFKIEEKDAVSFIVQLIVFVAVCAVVGFLIGIFAKLPIIGILFGIAGAAFEVYGFIGIILCVLKFLGLVK